MAIRLRASDYHAPNRDTVASMGGLGSLATAIEEILLDYGIHVPPWIGLAIAFGLIVLFLPNIIKNAKVDKARRDMTRLQDLSPEDRDRERERILDMANDNPVGLVAIADEALRKHQTAIARGAVDRLRRTGKRPADLQRLERALDGDKPRHLLKEVIAIEHLSKAGAREAAAARLAAALLIWPDAPELRELRETVDHPARTEVEKS
jgi:hypothetical protein